MGLAFASLTLLATGCSRIFDYPSSATERGAALCQDGADNDFDGRPDCDDSDCDGFCPETTSEQCRDGRDNDGDGLEDDADARCWLHFPPKTQRCAEASGVDVVETFDGAFLGLSEPSAAWAAWPLILNSETTAYDNGLAFLSPRITERRSDKALGFTDFGELASDPAVPVVRQRPFSGSWQNFKLSFSASLLPQTQLRAGIVPIALAPNSDVPLPGAESALASITLDAMVSTPTLTLDVEGKQFSTALPALPLCDGALCVEAFGKVSVSLDERGLKATLSYPNGDTAEVVAPAPNSPSLPASRLVLWGRSATPVHSPAIDDVYLSVSPEWPCGFRVPQIPGNDCDLGGEFDTFGHGVSVARGPRGDYCALVTARRGPGSEPEALTLWHSADGEIWAPVAPPEALTGQLPDGASLIGAGIGAGGAGWHTAIAYREPRGVRLGFADAATCDEWGDLVPGPTLVDDAEPPSYVILDGAHEIYFTTPPSTERRRALWRVLRDTSDSEPELLEELPLEVGTPVSVGLAGSSDRVLVYPRATGAAPPGVGLLVADAGERDWKRVDPSPLFELPPRLDSFQGQHLAFDDEGIVSAALAWHAGEGFLVYAGTARDGLGASTRSDPLLPILSVGTARLVSAARELPNDRVTPVRGCGDGICSAEETCASCAEDCTCAGVALLSDALEADNPWQVVSQAADPAASRYWGSDPPSLNWVGGEPTWSILPLEAAITGDFELSFDLRVIYGEPNGSCSIYAGLGTLPELETEVPANLASAAAGVFARFDLGLGCVDQFRATPFVLSENTRSDGPLDSFSCGAEQALEMDAWQHVVLRREAANVTMMTPRSHGCGSFEQTTSYAGSLGELTALLVGFGGGPFAGCAQVQSTDELDPYGMVKNVQLRVPDDPGDCPDGKQRCAEAAEQPSCVDLARSTDHCGTCGQSCGANETCNKGRCKCSDLAGILECDGACVDSLSSSEHCGECGHVCPGQCVRGSCAAVSRCPYPSQTDTHAGNLTLELPPGDATSDVCGLTLFSPVFLAWTAGATGRAVFEAEVGDSDLDTVVGVALEPSCEAWLACNDNHLDLGLGSRVAIEAVAGTTYWIAVGVLEPLHEAGQVELRIGPER